MRCRRLAPAALLLALVAAALFAVLSMADSGSAHWPSEVSKSLKKNGKLSVDATNISEGYFQAAIQKSTSKRMKLRVTKDKETLTYDLNGDAAFEVFPLQLGDGKYVVTLYEQVKGTKYSKAGSVSFNVKLSEPDICFLYPNQYVHYTQATAAVAKADELCAGKDAQAAYDAVCTFMSKNFVYDYIKAINIKNGVLPDIETSWSKRMGICQDLSAIMCCMLRTQGLPARLMIGYADNNYHAWVSVRFDGEDHFFDPTAAVNGIKKVKSYTLERFY